MFLLIFIVFLAVLAAGAPHMAPFMADECLLAMPEVDGLDYTMKEYMRYVEYVKECVERLNSQGKNYLLNKDSRVQFLLNKLKGSNEIDNVSYVRPRPKLGQY